jgi:hypothetical protein
MTRQQIVHLIKAQIADAEREKWRLSHQPPAEHTEADRERLLWLCGLLYGLRVLLNRIKKH